MAGELILFGVLGLAAGSFLTLVVERYDTAESILVGRSHCDHCKETLRWWELLPFVGYFIVRGQCPRCNKKIPQVYPFFELITSLAFVAVRATYPTPHYGLIALELLFVCSLLTLFFYDFLKQLFPGSLLLITALLGLLFVAIRAWATSQGLVGVLQQQIIASLIGAAVGGGALGLLAFPSKGTWMGYGDVIVGAILGLWVAYPTVIVALIMAFYSGALVGGTMLVTHRLRKDHRIAFGPFLILGGFIARVWGEPLWHAVLKLWGVA